MIRILATTTVTAAAGAVFLARPTVLEAAAVGIAALAFLLTVDAQQTRTPMLKHRAALLASAALLTATAVTAAALPAGWLRYVAPLAAAAAVFLATPPKPGKRSGSSVK
jgi:hypothetical protein